MACILRITFAVVMSAVLRQLFVSREVCAEVDVVDSLPSLPCNGRTSRETSIAYNMARLIQITLLTALALVAVEASTSIRSITGDQCSSLNGSVEERLYQEYPMTMPSHSIDGWTLQTPCTAQCDAFESG